MRYSYLTDQMLDVPEGTQQLPEVFAHLNGLAQDGARVVWVQGDLEDEFIIMLEHADAP